KHKLRPISTDSRRAQTAATKESCARDGVAAADAGSISQRASRIRATACEIPAVLSSLMCWESIALSAATLPQRTQLRSDLNHSKRLTMLMHQNFTVDLGNKQS